MFLSSVVAYFQAISIGIASQHLSSPFYYFNHGEQEPSQTVRTGRDSVQFSKLKKKKNLLSLLFLPSFFLSFCGQVWKQKFTGINPLAIEWGVKYNPPASCSLTLWTVTQFAIFLAVSTPVFHHTPLNFECAAHAGDRHDRDKTSSFLWSHRFNL